MCSLADDRGMRSCFDEKPNFIIEENNDVQRACNSTAELWVNNTYDSNSSLCVDWNQYYTVCRSEGENPFLGSISFDNILLAWVAIFQVRIILCWVCDMFVSAFLTALGYSSCNPHSICGRLNIRKGVLLLEVKASISNVLNHLMLKTKLYFNLL